MAFRRNSCVECAQHRAQVEPPKVSCKPKWGERLCDQIDPNLLNHLEDRTLSNAQRVHGLLLAGQVAAALYVDATPFPCDSATFEVAVLNLHRRIFEEGLPLIAGRFRTEPVTFGGARDHALQGAPPEAIATRVAQAFQLLAQPGLQGAKSAVAETCARFLEEFFRIHPFADGNGRVGREILRWVCAAKTAFRFSRFNTTGRERRRYFRALEYAHQHAPTSQHPRRNDRVNPYFYLANWLTTYLDEVPVDLDEVPPP